MCLNCSSQIHFYTVKNSPTMLFYRVLGNCDTKKQTPYGTWHWSWSALYSFLTRHAPLILQNNTLSQKAAIENPFLYWNPGLIVIAVKREFCQVLNGVFSIYLLMILFPGLNDCLKQRNAVLFLLSKLTSEFEFVDIWKMGILIIIRTYPGNVKMPSNSFTPVGCYYTHVTF